MTEKTIVDEMNENDLWHKIVGALIAKYGDQKLTIEDFQPIDGKTVVVTTENDGNTFVLRLIGNAEAERLAEEFQNAAKRKN